MDSATEKATVAIIGGGPAGIGAAIGLARAGVGRIVLIDRAEKLGGIPALHRKKPGAVPTFVQWTRGRIVSGEDFASDLVTRLAATNVEVWLESHVCEIEADDKRLVVVSPSKGKVRLSADAVVLATGCREKSLAERGWITGSRPSRVFFTKHLMDLIDHNDLLPCTTPAIVGSDLIDYAAAAKLRAAGSDDPSMLDARPRPACPPLARLWFRRWARPRWIGAAAPAEVSGDGSVEAVTPATREPIPCDGLVVSGELVPNSELALLGGLRVELPSRELVTRETRRLSAAGWYAAGGVLGGDHGAQWCYLSGLKTAKAVCRDVR